MVYADEVAPRIGAAGVVPSLHHHWYVYGELPLVGVTVTLNVTGLPPFRVCDTGWVVIARTRRSAPAVVTVPPPVMTQL